MPRSQLNVNLPPALLERLRQAAKQRQTTTTALVVAGLQAVLDGRLEASSKASSSDLEQRLATVEARLDGALQEWEAEHRKHGRPPKGNPVCHTEISDDQSARGIRRRLQKRAIAGDDQAQTIVAKLTTGELADRLGLRRRSLNERIRRAGGGAIGLEIEGWRIVGQARPAQGGPPQWQWQIVEEAS